MTPATTNSDGLTVEQIIARADDIPAAILADRIETEAGRLALAQRNGSSRETCAAAIMIAVMAARLLRDVLPCAISAKSKIPD